MQYWSMWEHFISLLSPLQDKVRVVQGQLQNSMPGATQDSVIAQGHFSRAGACYCGPQQQPLYSLKNEQGNNVLHID